MNRSFAVIVLLLVAIFGVCVLRYSPPSVRGVQTPAAEFSAARACEVQHAVAGDGASRVTGSEANARARGYLVLLLAHYDSVACGPGAADDGFGTSAAVEAARAIAVGPALRRGVIVVLTDGEGVGLLGARAFAEEHALARTVRGVVNVDSRGSAGPSAMFETRAGNGWIVGLLACHVELPVTSSLFYEIYRRMPNDTDFTAVKGLAQGVNFANNARVAHCHTPLDSLDNADPRTLQHHGEQALAMVRALANAGPELDEPRALGGDAVWFDVLALSIVRWPTWASPPLTLTALTLVIGWTIRKRAWSSGWRALPAALAALAVVPHSCPSSPP